MMMRSRFDGLLRAAWRGFTLIEVVVALVIVLILAAVALPNLAGYLQQKRVEATMQQLSTIALAATNPAPGANAFFQKVGSNPGRLSQLSEVIVQNNNSYATGSDDSCGNQFSGGERNNWISNGPFVNFQINRDSGMVTPIGRAADSLTRAPNSATSGILIVNFVNGVALEDAVLLDLLMEGGNGNLAGYVQWAMPAVNGLVVLRAGWPINNVC